MAKILKFINKFEKKLSHVLTNEGFLLHFYLSKKIFKSQKFHFNQREICIFCNRYIIEKFKHSKLIQIDNHLADHSMFDDLPTHIPVSTYQSTIDLESIIINVNMQKSFQIWENFFFFLSKKLVLPNYLAYYVNNVRKDRDYIFLKYRLSGICTMKKRKKRKWKNILHGWNEIKGSKNNLVPQRGEFLIVPPESIHNLQSITIEKKAYRTFFQKSIFFFRFFNKKKYEWNLLKRLNCQPLYFPSLRSLNLLINKEIENVRFFNFYEYLTNSFFYAILKLSNIDINFSFRFNFLYNLFNYPKANNNFLQVFTRNFLNINTPSYNYVNEKNCAKSNFTVNNKIN